MNFLKLAAMLCLTLVAGSVGAQDVSSTVSQSAVTWQALEAKVDMVNSRMEAAAACGALGKIYAAGAPAALAGCMEATANGQTLTQIISNFNLNLATVNNRVGKIIECNTRQMVFDGNNCVSPPAASLAEVISTNGWRQGTAVLNCSKGGKIVNVITNTSTGRGLAPCTTNGLNCPYNRPECFGKSSCSFGSGNGFISAVATCS